MTWVDRYFVGAWLFIGGCGIWAMYGGAPTWFKALVVAACVIHLLLDLGTRGALRPLRRGVMRVAARIGGASPAANVKVATEAVARLQEALAAAETRCQAVSAPSDETRPALLETKAGTRNMRSVCRQIAADYERAAASFRTLEADLSAEADRIDGLIAAMEGGDR